jgi:hypothetical protein
MIAHCTCAFDSEGDPCLFTGRVAFGWSRKSYLDMKGGEAVIGRFDFPQHVAVGDFRMTGTQQQSYTIYCCISSSGAVLMGWRLDLRARRFSRDQIWQPIHSYIVSFVRRW